jgi:hypothetical protein
MAAEEQKTRFLAALGELGGCAGNGKLRETLGWKEATYEAVKQALLNAGAITPGRGQGGSVAVAGQQRAVLAKKTPAPARAVRGNRSTVGYEANLRPTLPTRQMKLTLQQLEAHLWGAANILRGRTAGQDYKNYILSLMFYKRLCDQWECEADDAIAELERQQGR